MRVQLPLYLISSIITLAAAADTSGTAPVASTSTTSSATIRTPAPTSPTRAWLPFDLHLPTSPLIPPDAEPEDERDDTFESFEEWKRRREAEEQEVPPPEPPKEVPPQPPQVNKTDPIEQRNETKVDTPPERKTGHRYNYAAPDCGARVLSSSPSTQNAPSILHKSKDRYMLTPCRSDEHWVVVELCDEIRVEAVEVAVWEFFSGIIRSVRVSVGDDSEGEWSQVGEFVGKNVRGVQAFTLPEATGFRRFLRVDFPSFYGTEYYCPVSHLKVYGMNQMEAFKMEQKAAAQAKDAQHERLRERERERAREIELEREAAEMYEKEREVLEHAEEALRERELCELERLVQEQARRSGRLDVDTLFAEVVECPAPTASQLHCDSLPTPGDNVPVNVPNASNASIAATTNNASNTNGSVLNVSANTTDYSFNPPNPSSQASGNRSQANGTGPTGYHIAPRTDASESIYAFIIRRLNALEGNSTLVARYIDEQAKALRATLAKSEKKWEQAREAATAEESQRAEAERIRQDVRLTRIMTQLDAMRSTFETERRSTEAQLRVLTDELGFERRRSLAQLIVLMSIIVLGALTRGEMIDALLRPLVSDVLKRRSSWHRDGTQRDGAKRLSSGPLAGLLIDIPTANTTPQARPTTAPRSPRSPLKRRPLTPITTPRRRGIRSVSAAEFAWLDEEPRRRTRKLARSSHLHMMRRRDSASEGERERIRGSLGDWTEDGLSASASEVDEELRWRRDGTPRSKSLTRPSDYD